jgi:hypothetical protein
VSVEQHPALHCLCAHKVATSDVSTWISQCNLKTLASDVRPLNPTPIWASILSIFFWYEASSPGDRFRATRIECVLEVRPTVALPCFTASWVRFGNLDQREIPVLGACTIAYSTWWILPWGDQVVLSPSYWLRNMQRPGARPLTGLAHA